MLGLLQTHIPPVSHIALEYLSEGDIQFAKGAMPDGKKCQYAAGTGNLRLLQELRAGGCPWTNGRASMLPVMAISRC